MGGLESSISGLIKQQLILKLNNGIILKNKVNLIVKNSRRNNYVVARRG